MFSVIWSRFDSLIDKENVFYILANKWVEKEKGKLYIERDNQWRRIVLKKFKNRKWIQKLKFIIKFSKKDVNAN